MKSSLIKKLKYVFLIISIVSIVFTKTIIAKTTNKNTYFFDKNILQSKYVGWAVKPNNKASINLLPSWKLYKKQKKQVIVAVIDTGVDPNHPFLIKNIFTYNGQLSNKNYGIDFSYKNKGKNIPIDKHGHGTHISGIIKQTFPSVKLLTLKYYGINAPGHINLKSSIEALRYAVSKNIDIINYSGGGPDKSKEELKLLKLAEKKGIMVVAASGNDSKNLDKLGNSYYPANYNLNNIISVTAHDEKLNILRTSNYGKKVDIAAPGKNIISSLPNGYSGYLTGTSQATAFVTGVAAMIKSHYPQLKTKKIIEIIKKSSKKEKTLTNKTNTNGRLDAAAAFKLAGDYAENRVIANKKK